MSHVTTAAIIGMVAILFIVIMWIVDDSYHIGDNDWTLDKFDVDLFKEEDDDSDL